MQLMLSILIPSTPDRRKDLPKLLECISEQSYTRKVDVFDIGEITASKYFDLLSEIEIIVFEDEKIMTIGEKRELLYKYAKGGYSIQIDSDDLLAPTAIKLILETIRSNPEVDVITFEEYVNIDGKEYKSNHSNEYADWEGDGNNLFPDGFHFHRTAFFKSVIRTELAKSVPVPHIRFGEDHQWAQALKPHLKTEIHINQQLYKYLHISTNFNERYGIT